MPKGSPASRETPSPVWLEWLRKPHELADLIAGKGEGEICLPLDDLRLQCWFELSSGERQ
jgi:hypothetical protein